MTPQGLYLADTSAIARFENEAVRNDLVNLGRQGLLATCATVELEVLYSARTPAEYEDIRSARMLGFTMLEMHPGVGERALSVQRAMARESQHRGAGIVDLLTTAVAEHYGAILVHYDRDFEAIAQVTGQATKWVVPPGSIP